MYRQQITFFLALLLILNFGCDRKAESPDPGIIATFSGGQITRKQVEDYIKSLIQEVGSDALKEIRRKDVIENVVKTLTVDYIVKEKIKQKKLGKRENIKHVMKHISEELNIEKLHSQAHQKKIKVTESEIRRYYEQNRDQYNGRSLSEAREEIHNILQMQKEKPYFQNYIEELKKKAEITRNYQLLNVPEPGEVNPRLNYGDQSRVSGSAKKPPAEETKDFRALQKQEMEKKWFKQNQNKTLFTIHGKRYTVGEFYRELEELPLQEREKYKGFEGLKKLVDRMIERMLVLEDTYDQMLQVENKEQFEHMREDILKQLLHQEEVDDKIEVSEEEMKAFYSERQEQFVEPPSVKISYIRIGRGQAKDEYDRGEKKAKEAYKKLKPGFWKKGEPFEKVAREYSEDPETAKNGGVIDKWISESADMFVEIASHPFHENVLGLSAGEISSPFYLQGSWYIVKVRERKEPRPLSFEEVREQIETELTARKHEELTHDMGNQLLEQANLVVYDDVVESILNKVESTLN